MARGDLTSAEQARVAAAVSEAERVTGLEMCVVVCRPGPEATRAQAEQAFARLGLEERPSVLVMVLPRARKVEVVTSPTVHDRISDADCAAAVEQMIGPFAAGDLADGIEAGLAVLAQRAGSATASPERPELPDIVDA